MRLAEPLDLRGDLQEAQAELRKGHLVRVLPGWKPVGAFAETIYAIRPYAPHVPRAVTALVAHLRSSLESGFGV